MSSLKLHLLQSNKLPSYVTITDRPATFEEKYLIPEFDPILRSQPQHHQYCNRIATQLKENTRYVCLETPHGLQAVGVCPNGDVKHYCFKESEILTWSIIDALRQRGIPVSRENFETIEINLSDDSLDEDEKAKIIQFLAAARAFGKAKTFGVASIKRNPRIFAKKMDSCVESIFASVHGTLSSRKKCPAKKKSSKRGDRKNKAIKKKT